ncbi:e3 ubiquitin-protein ligase [Seminavis robusta]|uniref:E3 ubiquitin-protein ligase n=1 Tax=Seminavis robusta TaxID=568900 RepID=A0A9N8ERW7_9STRA|nr:e3 ubiquitin-protein ligase [Seminavis robusta]|eukprot:Sro1511_g278700.1 e3 ubiquitin-protein ligase (130) ;mRNA; r:7709-8098
MTVSTTPAHFICPLTHAIMSRPVQHRYTEHSFEHDAVMELIGEGNALCPLTGESLTADDFDDNIELEREIRKWNKKRIGRTVSKDSTKGSTSPKVRERLCKTKAAHVLGMRNKVLQQREERLRALQAVQ